MKNIISPKMILGAAVCGIVGGLIGDLSMHVMQNNSVIIGLCIIFSPIAFCLWNIGD